MDIFADLIAVTIISLLAAISPGPDFFMVVKNSLSYSRRSALLTALGIVSGLTVHITYTLLGMGIVIAHNPFLYQLIQYVGVSYLFYIGMNSLLSSFKTTSKIDLHYQKELNDLSPFQAFSQGFFTNALNPKAALFFISFFSQFITIDTPLYIGLLYGFITCFVAFIWFSSLAFVLSAKSLTGRIDRFRMYIERAMGSVLILLGFKLLEII